MANVTLSVTIPDAHVDTVLRMLNNLSGKNLFLRSNGVIEWKFNFDGKQNGETNKAFAERYIKSFIRASVRLNEYTMDAQRHATETLAIAQPAQNVPDEIIA
jgi:cysteinyl-tRNA synthetase